MAQKENKHPKGLMVLFFTEMWERFGFYLMLGIFTLFMLAGEDAQFPGLGMSKAESADIYGSYLALVYLTPFFGGLIADRVLGYRKSIFFGGLLMAAGYFGLAYSANLLIFFIALGLIVAGNGLFKPNISVLLGKLYEDERYVHLKDAGFNIFYMGINIGAFVSNFIAAYLRLEYGWGWAFAAAGIGMLIGVFWLLFGQFSASRIKEVDVVHKPRVGEKSTGKVIGQLFGPALIAGAIGWFIPGNILGEDSTDAFLFFSIPVVIYYINLIRNADPEEKEPVKALVSVFAVVVIFWAVFHQNGSALTFWAKNNTDREVNKTVENIIPDAMIEEASTVPRVVKKAGLHGKFKGYEVGGSYYYNNYTQELPKGNLPRKDGEILKPTDVQSVYQPDYISESKQKLKRQIENAETESDKKAAQEKLEKWKKSKDKWLKETGLHDDNKISWDNVKEEKKSTWGRLKLWPTELQASINPFYIIILTPLVVGLLAFLRRRNREPTTPGKLGIGLLITALSMFVMVGAAMVSDGGVTKTSVGWLFGVYGVITVGELFLSPMGLSFVSKLSPKRFAAVMMGGWFLATALGNKLSGVLSGLWELYGNKAYFFLTNVVITLLAALAIFLLLPWLKRVVRKYSE